MASVYRTATVTRFDHKNVIYLAYVGVHDQYETYKYGKSSNVYQREMTAHRKTFGDKFQMRGVYETNYKDQVELLLAKELKVRDLHRKMNVNNRNQTELFITTPTYTFEYVESLLKDIIHDFDCMDSKRIALEVEKLKVEKLRLQLELKRISMYSK